MENWSLLNKRVENCGPHETSLTVCLLQGCLPWLRSSTNGSLQCPWTASIVCGALTAASQQSTGLFMAPSVRSFPPVCFEWGREDVQRLKEMKRAEWKGSHSGQDLTEEPSMAAVSPRELKKHSRKKIRAVEELRSMISWLLQ